MHYYNQIQHIAQVDLNDNVIGKVEKWEAHKKGNLHRAFTVALFYKNQVILQHRKHPAFDGVFDLTTSSHQIYTNDVLQDDVTAIYSTLQREWNLEKDFITEPTKLGKFWYEAIDPNSEYKEQEINYYYKAEVTQLPQPNLDFAHGFSLVPLEDLKSGKNPLYPLLAPWVKEAFKQGII